MSARPEAPAGNPAKQALRRELLVRRRELDSRWRAKASAAIARRLLHLIDQSPRPIRSLALYASFGAEVQTHDLIGRLLARRVTVALPYILHAERTLELRVIDCFPEGLERGDFGILQPTPLRHPEVRGPDGLDLLVVPGVGFDRRGNRLGYGGGYYDHVLLEERHAPVVGLAFGAQLVEAIPADPWDRPVDAIVTETGLLNRSWAAAPPG